MKAGSKHKRARKREDAASGVSDDDNDVAAAHACAEDDDLDRRRSTPRCGARCTMHASSLMPRSRATLLSLVSGTACDRMHMALLR